MLSSLMCAALLASTLSLPQPRLKGERIALYLAAASDVLTTRMAFRHGAHEGNPLLTPIIGKTPSTLKLVAVKVASIGVIEYAASYWRRRGRHKVARAIYHLSALSWGYAAGFNLRFVFK